MNEARLALEFPAGACDAHVHVFGPSADFPYAEPRSYTPAESPKAALAALHERLGLERAVIVQPACYGTDNAAMLDAIAADPGARRGAALIDEGFDDAAFARLHDGGVRAIRLNFIRRLGDFPESRFIAFAHERARELGWHILLHLEGSDVQHVADIVKAFQVPYVLDHMAKVDATLGLGHPTTAALLDLARRELCWMKISGADRVSPPPFSAAVALARALIEIAPDRVLWGTDFPHPNSPHPVSADQLKDLVGQYVAGPEMGARLLVANPARLYGFA